jgi:hypothetical protein
MGNVPRVARIRDREQAKAIVNARLAVSPKVAEEIRQAHPTANRMAPLAANRRIPPKVRPQRSRSNESRYDSQFNTSDPTVGSKFTERSGDAVWMIPRNS